MARIILDALSHQAVRELGSEAATYGTAPAEAGRWAGQRLTGLRQALGAAGYDLAIAPPDADVLDEAAALIVGSRSQLVPFDALETDAISAFVETGGGLLLMANHRGLVRPQQQLAEALKLPISFNDISVVDGPRIGIVLHELTAGVEAIAVRNCCSLRLAAGAEPLALFSEPGHVFAAVMRVGLGRVVAVADSGFIASRDDAGRDMFASASNARFIGSILGWMTGRT